MPTMFAPFQGQVVGANFQSLSPGFLIRGLSIDNPSGSWLFITSSNTYVPPYTLGYRATMKPAALQVSVEYATSGPGGQTSTLLGSPASINLYSQPVVDAPGNAFLNPDGTPLGTVIVASSPNYSAPAPIYPCGVNIFAWDALALGSSGLLRRIVFHSPSVAQTYTINRLGGVASGGDVIVPTPLIVPPTVLPGTVRVPPRGTVSIGPVTPPGAAGLALALTIPNDTQPGDLLLMVAIANGNANTNPTSGLGTFVQLQKQIADPTITHWLYARTAIAGDAGSVINLGYAAPTRVRYGVIIRISPYTGGALASAVGTGNTPAAVVPATADGIYVTIMAKATATTSATPSTTPVNSDIREHLDFSSATGSLYVETVLYNGVANVAPNAVTCAAIMATSTSVTIPLSTVQGAIGGLLYTTPNIPIGVDTTVDLEALGIPIGVGSGATGGIIIRAPAAVLSNPTFDFALTGE